MQPARHLAEALRAAYGPDYQPRSPWEARLFRPTAVETPEALAERRRRMAARDALLERMEDGGPGVCFVCQERHEDGWLLGERWVCSVPCAEELDGAVSAEEAA